MSKRCIKLMHDESRVLEYNNVRMQCTLKLLIHQLIYLFNIASSKKPTKSLMILMPTL